MFPHIIFFILPQDREQVRSLRCRLRLQTPILQTLPSSHRTVTGVALRSIAPSLDSTLLFDGLKFSHLCFEILHRLFIIQHFQWKSKSWRNSLRFRAFQLTNNHFVVRQWRHRHVKPHNHILGYSRDKYIVQSPQSPLAAPLTAPVICIPRRLIIPLPMKSIPHIM